jgi:rod shape-determining protein MreD
LSRASESFWYVKRWIINLYIGIPLLILVAVLQSSILPQIRIFGLVPNLMLLTVVAWSFRRGPNDGIVWGMIGGLMIDLASGAPLGISPLPLMIAALVVGAGRARIFSGNLVLPVIISLLTLALYQVLYVVLLMLVGQPVSWEEGVLRVAAPLVFLNLVLMPIVYIAISWLARLTEGSRVRLGR